MEGNLLISFSTPVWYIDDDDDDDNDRVEDTCPERGELLPLDEAPLDAETKPSLLGLLFLSPLLGLLESELLEPLFALLSVSKPYC